LNKLYLHLQKKLKNELSAFMKGLDFASVAPGDATLEEDEAVSESEEEAQGELETESDTSEEENDEDDQEEQDQEAEEEDAFEAKDFVSIGDKPKPSQNEVPVKADSFAESDDIPGFVKKSGLANTENASITVGCRLNELAFDEGKLKNHVTCFPRRIYLIPRFGPKSPPPKFLNQPFLSSQLLNSVSQLCNPGPTR